MDADIFRTSGGGGGGGSKGLGEILPYKFRKSRLVCNGYE